MYLPCSGEHYTYHCLSILHLQALYCTLLSVLQIVSLSQHNINLYCKSYNNYNMWSFPIIWLASLLSSVVFYPKGMCAKVCKWKGKSILLVSFWTLHSMWSSAHIGTFQTMYQSEWTQTFATNSLLARFTQTDLSHHFLLQMQNLDNPTSKI